MQWNLNALYSGFEDLRFHEDLNIFEIEVDVLNQWSPDDTKPTDTILAYLNRLEKLMRISDRLMHFCELTYTADTSHPEAQKYLIRLEEIQSKTAAVETRFHHYIGTLADLSERIVAEPALTQWEDYLKELQQTAKYQLSEATESLLAALRVTGSSSWEQLHSLLTSDLIVTVPLPEGNAKLPLAEVRNLASHKDSVVRKIALESELKAYPAIEQAAALTLNAIKGEVITLGTVRGYSGPLDEALSKSRMERDTLDTLIHSIEKHLPIFEKMYQKKARLLGHDNGLPFCDLFAPLEGAHRTYTQNEAIQVITACFEGFSPEMGAFAKNAFESHWIDWSPRQGKVGGAFCSYAHSIEESRILTNFTGSFEDITTLAHELGHGYHDAQLSGLSILNTQYPMPLAETASIFCETLVAKSLMNQMTPPEQVPILEMRLQMIGQVITDIYSRFLFEQALFNTRKDFSMQPAELCKLMEDCQKKAYGKGLDPNCLHPYMWVCKPHYYSAGLSFYNFPYAFGLLFSTGLYAQYQENRDIFIPKYNHLLRHTGMLSVENTGLLAGIDLRKPDFWEGAFTILKEEVETFLSI